VAFLRMQRHPASTRRGRRRRIRSIWRGCRDALGGRVWQVDAMTAPTVDHEPNSAGSPVHCPHVPGARWQDDLVLAVTSDGRSHGVVRSREHEFHPLRPSAIRGATRPQAADEDRALVVRRFRQSTSGARGETQHRGRQRRRHDELHARSVPRRAVLRRRRAGSRSGRSCSLPVLRSAAPSRAPVRPHRRAVVGILQRKPSLAGKSVPRPVTLARPVQFEVSACSKPGARDHCRATGTKKPCFRGVAIASQPGRDRRLGSHRGRRPPSGQRSPHVS
jgi:hypothetical protein